VKVVIDTNVFVSSFLNPSGSPRAIIDLWKNGQVTLCLCAEILTEYIDVLGRFRIPPADLKNLLELFKSRQFMEFAVISGDLQVVPADPADNKFIECALVSGAKYLVSGDKHLLSIGRYGMVQIVKAMDFLAHGFQTGTKK
jgi:putative PIN family toxin of toxin-antitoxin system